MALKAVPEVSQERPPASIRARTASDPIRVANSRKNMSIKTHPAKTISGSGDNWNHPIMQRSFLTLPAGAGFALPRMISGMRSRLPPLHPCAMFRVKTESQMTALARTQRRATYEDVLDAPPHVVAEVLSGTLHTHPRSFKVRHLYQVIPFLYGAGMQVGLRHFDSRTLDWLAVALRSGAHTRHALARELCRAHRLAQRPWPPVPVGSSGGAADARGARRDRASARPRFWPATFPTPGWPARWRISARFRSTWWATPATAACGKR